MKCVSLVNDKVLSLTRNYEAITQVFPSFAHWLRSSSLTLFFMTSINSREKYLNNSGIEVIITIRTLFQTFRERSCNEADY